MARTGFTIQYIFTLLLVLCSARMCWAQLKATHRYEREIKPNDDALTIIPLKDFGLSIIRDEHKYNDGKQFWEVTLLDSNLIERWTGELALPPRYRLIGYETLTNFLILLYREGDNSSRNFLAVRFDVNSRQSEIFEINQEFTLRLTHFSALPSCLIFGGYVNQEPAVVLYEFATNTMKVVPGFFLKDTELLDVRTNHNNTFNALLVDRNSGSHRNLVVRTYDEVGRLLVDDQIEIPMEKTILSGMTSRLERDELMIFGTYAYGKSKQASGFYSVPVDPFSTQEVKYFDFVTFDHFLDYLKPRQIQKEKSKGERRIALGKPPLYRAYVQALRMEESSRGFYLLAESYNSSSNANSPYWNNSYSPYYGYGYSPYGYNPYMNRYYNPPYNYNNPNKNTSVEMVESVLSFFDAQGNLLWDVSLQLGDRKLSNLEQCSDFVDDSDFSSLAYKEDQDLFIKTKLFGEDSIRMDTLKLPLKNKTDVVRYESDEESGVRFWYDKSLFIWGYQSIRNREHTEEDPVRHVFYIVKAEKS